MSNNLNPFEDFDFDDIFLKLAKTSFYNDNDTDLKNVKHYLNSGGPIDACNFLGNSLLHIAVQKNNIELVKLLLDHSISLNTINANKKTPLQTAAFYKNRFDVIKILIDAGAKFYQLTPL